jgi:hypothetical protein
MIAAIETGIVEALRASDQIDIADASIVIATQEAERLGALLSSGGITVQYAGSTLSQPMATGQPLRRQLIFIVTIGRKGLTEQGRLSGDIDAIVDVLTKAEPAGFRLTWVDDRFAQVRNNVFWHDLTFQATVVHT